MKKVVNLVTNYAFPVAWIVISKPGPPSIFRAAVAHGYQTSIFYEQPLPVDERGRLLERAGKYWFLGNEWEYNEMIEICKYL